jgi:hypothetical protein
LCLIRQRPYHKSYRSIKRDQAPTKRWSPVANEHMWSMFTHVNRASGGKAESTEAYAVKDDILVHLRLPCGGVPDAAACGQATGKYTDLILHGIDETFGNKSQNPFRDLPKL